MVGAKQREQDTNPLLQSRLLHVPPLPQPVLLLLLQIRLSLHLGLVEPVDDGILPLRHQYAPHLLGVAEAHLADVHGAVLLEVRPRRVDDGDVVLFVALDRVGLGQLGEVGDKVLREGVPLLGVGHAQVDVRAGELVDMELGMMLEVILPDSSSTVGWYPVGNVSGAALRMSWDRS
jgi:hypothetical protein